MIYFNVLFTALFLCVMHHAICSECTSRASAQFREAHRSTNRPPGVLFWDKVHGQTQPGGDDRDTHGYTLSYLVFPPFLKSCLGCAKNSCGKMHRSRSKLDRHCTYNVTQELSFNHCCSGTAISVTHSDCVFVALGIHHAMCMCHNIICGLPGFTIFFHIFS